MRLNRMPKHKLQVEITKTTPTVSVHEAVFVSMIH